MGGRHTIYPTCCLEKFTFKAVFLFKHDFLFQRLSSGRNNLPPPGSTKGRSPPSHPPVNKPALDFPLWGSIQPLWPLRDHLLGLQMTLSPSVFPPQQIQGSIQVCLAVKAPQGWYLALSVTTHAPGESHSSCSIHSQYLKEDLLFLFPPHLKTMDQLLLPKTNKPNTTWRVPTLLQK